MPIFASMRTSAALVVSAWASVALAEAQQTPQNPQAPQAPQTPQTPQTPQGSSQSSQTTVVVPPPADHTPVIVPPQDRPVAVAPCPPQTVVRREYRNPVATVLTDSLLGGVAGAAVGAAVGLANSDNRREQWERDIGTGAVAGFAVGASTGGVLAYLDYDAERRDEHHATNVGLTNRPMLAFALGGRF